MDCRRFLEILADFEEGKLPPGELVDAETHVETCSACRRLCDIIKGRIDVLADGSADELTRSIMDHTSGPACSRIESRLWDFPGGEPAEDSQLVGFHLEHCAGCRSIAEDFAVLREELPAMAEIEPPGSFLGEVLCLTSGQIPNPHVWRIRLQSWWDSLIRRPLFSYEAAYVGTLLLVMAFSPFLPFRELLIQKTPSTVIQLSAERLLSFWADAKAPLSGRLYKFASATDLSRRTVAEPLREFVKSCGAASTSLLDRSVRAVSAFGRDLIRNSKFEME